MIFGKANVPIEFALSSPRVYADIFNEIDVDVIFTGPGGEEWKVPAFWSGDGIFRVRFAAPEPGRYTYRSVCTKHAGQTEACDDPGLHNQIGEIEIIPYDGSNNLYRRGRLRVSSDQRTLIYADGAPFFWMGDTWWMGLCARFEWPDGVRRLAADRVAKGFNLIQIVAGPLPGFHAETESWHPKQANEAGWSWEEDWARINPAFYDLADLRIAYLVECGLMPCIVGMWGYYISFMGEQNAKKHWRNLVARYGAYPVIWCIAGEVGMPTYSRHSDPKAWEAERVSQGQSWANAANYVKEIDPYSNLITAHPPCMSSSRKSLADDTPIDIDMLQTPHGGHGVLKPTADIVLNTNAQEPRIPVVNGEPCYEGIIGTGWQEVQRFLFWTSITSGSAGHTYGAQGIFQLNVPEEQTSEEWGEGIWETAMHYAGSKQVPLGKRLLERYPWWRFQPRREPEIEKRGRIASFAAGIPGSVWIFYWPAVYIDDSMAGMQGIPVSIEPNASYKAFFFDPRTAAEIEIGPVHPDSDDLWLPPARPTMEDWVLVLEEEEHV